MSRIKIPFLAARVVVIVVTVGIARPRAWGQAITITEIANVLQKLQEMFPGGLERTSKGK